MLQKHFGSHKPTGLEIFGRVGREEKVLSRLSKFTIIDPQKPSISFTKTLFNEAKSQTQIFIK